MFVLCSRILEIGRGLAREDRRRTMRIPSLNRLIIFSAVTYVLYSTHVLMSTGLTRSRAEKWSREKKLEPPYTTQGKTCFPAWTIQACSQGWVCCIFLRSIEYKLCFCRWIAMSIQIDLEKLHPARTIAMCFLRPGSWSTKLHQHPGILENVKGTKTSTSSEPVPVTMLESFSALLL